MITLSNDHSFEHMVPSGALGFDGKGWFWERPLVGLGLMKPKLFTVVLRTLTLNPRLYPVSNLSWIRPWTWMPSSPWSCVRLLPNGAVNKVGLYNPGFKWWYEKVGPRLDYDSQPLVGSIFGEQDELVTMAEAMNDFDFVALEINPSCPNRGHAMQTADEVVKITQAVKAVSRHPLIIKASVDQDYLAIAEGLHGVAEAISLNSVPWATAFADGQTTPLHRLEKRVGGGGGGVSGKPAQLCNWAAVERLSEQGMLPVIGPSVMEYEDMAKVRDLGAKAVSFGAIHLPTKGKFWTLVTNPCKPTRFVEREMRESAHHSSLV